MPCASCSRAAGRRRRRSDGRHHFPTHSREQSFYFDDEGRLRRLDYTAEVFGGWAKAAHVCLAHDGSDGIPVPVRRRVTPRGGNGRPKRLPVMVSLELEDVRLC